MKCLDCKTENFGICPRKDKGLTYPSPKRCEVGSYHKSVHRSMRD